MAYIEADTARRRSPIRNRFTPRVSRTRGRDQGFLHWGARPGFPPFVTPQHMQHCITMHLNTDTCDASHFIMIHHNNTSNIASLTDIHLYTHIVNPRNECIQTIFINMMTSDNLQTSRFQYKNCLLNNKSHIVSSFSNFSAFLLQILYCLYNMMTMQ